MLTKEEQELLEADSIKQELDAIQEQKKAQNAAIMPQKWIKGLVFALIMSLVLVGVGVFIAINGLNSRYFIEGFPALTMTGGLIGLFGLIWVFVSIRGLAKKKAVFGRSIMVAPDGEIPDFPEETIAKAPVAPIRIDEDRPMAVKKIYADDPEKRIIKMDKKKVERVLDHNITFPKLAEAFRNNLAAERLSVAEEDAKAFIGTLAFSRLIFVQGVAEENQEKVISSIAIAMSAPYAMLTGENNAALKDYVHNLVPANLQPNRGFVGGVNHIEFADVASFFAGYAEMVTDFSADHPLPSGSFSMNLIFVVFLPDGPLTAIPPFLLEKASLLNLPLAPIEGEDLPQIDTVSVRSTGDEVRYLALREKVHYFLPDESISHFDGAFDLAERKGFPLHNDVENALEREEAALLMMDLTPERVSGLVFANSYLPYLLVALEPNAITEEGGLREVIEGSFADEECSLPVRASFRRLHSTVKKGGTK